MHIALILSTLISATPHHTDLVASACLTPYQDAAIVSAAMPEYPDSARGLQIGKVQVTVVVTIGPSGSLVNARIAQSAGAMAIDQAALSAARQSTYTPKIVNCQPVQGTLRRTMTFDPYEDAPDDTTSTPQPSPSPAIPEFQGPAITVTPTPSRHSTNVGADQAALHACENTVLANEIQSEKSSGIYDDPDYPRRAVSEIDGRARVGACVAKRGYPRTGILLLRAALHLKSHPDAVEAPITDGYALAYQQLALLEYRVGDKAAAVAHIAEAYRLNEQLNPITQHPDIVTDFKRISQSGLARVRAQEEAKFQHDTADLSSDQRDVVRQMGWPDHVETYDASGYHEETWWYGVDSYYAAYTFINGTLTSTYNP